MSNYTTITYSDMTKLYQAKAKRYTKAQARAAVIDIDDTLKLHKCVGGFRPQESPYVAQLFCERDAMMGRYLKK